MPVVEPFDSDDTGPASGGSELEVLRPRLRATPDRVGRGETPLPLLGSMDSRPAQPPREARAAGWPGRWLWLVAAVLTAAVAAGGLLVGAAVVAAALWAR